jgi:hypothetical protein
MDEIILKFAGKIISGIKTAASFVVARVLAAFGLSWVLYDATMPPIKAYLTQQFMRLDPRAIDFFGFVGLDVAAVMVVSALVTKMGTRVFLSSASKVEQMIQKAGG